METISSLVSLDSLELSARAHNALERLGATNIYEVSMFEWIDLLKLKNVGRHTLKEIEICLDKHDSYLGKNKCMRDHYFEYIGCYGFRKRKTKTKEQELMIKEAEIEKAIENVISIYKEWQVKAKEYKDLVLGTQSQ